MEQTEIWKREKIRNDPTTKTIPLPLILASQSPQRQKLLTEAGFVFDVFPPDEGVEDNRRPNEKPADYVQRLALQKAQNVAEKIKRGRIIACDTIVVCNEKILEKPVDRTDARKMLRFLRGRGQLVLSGLCLLTKRNGSPAEKERAQKYAPKYVQEYVLGTETTALLMQSLSDQEIEQYLDSDRWRGKAGGFGYQDGNARLILIEGSESNIVGLPMELLEKMLKSV